MLFLSNSHSFVSKTLCRYTRNFTFFLWFSYWLMSSCSWFNLFSDISWLLPRELKKRFKLLKLFHKSEIWENYESFRFYKWVCFFKRHPALSHKESNQHTGRSWNSRITVYKYLTSLVNCLSYKFNTKWNVRYDSLLWKV